MTKLNKSIKRETEACFRKLPIIIQIEPPGIVRVKEKGRRTWYETSVEAIFCMAARTGCAPNARPRGRRNTVKRGDKKQMEPCKCGGTEAMLTFYVTSPWGWYCTTCGCLRETEEECR